MFWGKSFLKLMMLILSLNVILANRICPISDVCPFGYFYYLHNFWAIEYISRDDYLGFICHVEDNTYQFNFKVWEYDKYFKDCSFPESLNSGLELRFPGNQKTLMEASFNLQSLFEFLIFSINYSGSFYIHYTNVGGFGIDLAVKQDYLTNNQIFSNASKNNFYVGNAIINSRLDFYLNGKILKSCRDLFDSNGTLVMPNSIFQIIKIDTGVMDLVILNCQQSQPICPLVFKDSKIKSIVILKMSDYFFKKRMITFTNDTFEDLNLNVTRISFFNCDYITFDSKLLNPSVFKHLESIYTDNSVKSIDNEIFGRLEKLALLDIKAFYFRKIIHRQGIEWIRSKNRHLNVNLGDLNDIRLHKDKIFRIMIQFYWGKKFSDVFPDMDFCLYKDLPFKQLVIFISHINNDASVVKHSTPIPTCTYRWLVQYYSVMGWFLDPFSQNSMRLTLYLEKLYPSTCDFKKLIENCNKTNFKVTQLWDRSEVKIFSFYFQVILNISLYFISVFGIVTNSIFVYMIVSKNNQDIFKGCKQYIYLCALSIYNIIILSIQIVSWLSECKKHYDIFCPYTSRLVPFQFFKIIFTEVVVPTLRFMSNFAYMAFAFNRVALIGKDNIKIVEKVSKWTPKKYILVTGIISILFCVIKGFKYHVNYDHAERSYPYSNEEDVDRHHPVSRKVFLLINLVSDLFNYVLFVLINLAIDIYMLVRLRRTLNEKSKSNIIFMISCTKLVQKELEMRDSMNNAIRMVVVNSILNFLLKLFFSIASIESAAAIFYFESKYFVNCGDRCRYGFVNMWDILRNTGIHRLLPEFAEWLYSVLISIQIFIYSKFDKKIEIGLDRLTTKDKINEKQRSKSLTKTN